MPNAKTIELAKALRDALRATERNSDDSSLLSDLTEYLFKHARPPIVLGKPITVDGEPVSPRLQAVYDALCQGPVAVDKVDRLRQYGFMHDLRKLGVNVKKRQLQAYPVIAEYYIATDE